MWVNGTDFSTVQTIGYNKNLNGTWGTAVGTYSTVSEAFSAVQGVVDMLGFPWIMVGEESSIGASTSGLLAYNLGIIGQVPSDSFPAGQGLSLPGESTNTCTPGYAPWTDYESAKAGILALVGNYNTGA